MRWFSILLLIAVLIFTCEADSIGGMKNIDKSEPFISAGSKGGGSRAFFCHSPDDYMFFYIDSFNIILRAKRPDGSILEFNTEHLRRRNSIQAKAEWDISVRREWYRKEPVLYYVTNMKTYNEGVVLFYREQKLRRVVQFINKDLKVIRAWEDNTLMRSTRLIPEPVAVTADGEVFACGEKGELLKYDLNGNVVKRFVFPGVFNESRIVEPRPVSEGEKSIYTPESVEEFKELLELDARRLTKKVAERDKLLPDPISLSGPEMPTFIKAIEITGDNAILLMDDSKIYEIDQDAATIKPLNITDLVFSKDEKLRGMRVRDDYLLLITEKRTLSIDIGKKSIIGERETVHRLPYAKAAWDVIPPRTFLLAGINKRKITEYDCPVPRNLLKSRKLSSGQMKSKVIRLGEQGLEIRNDGLYYEPSGTEPFSGSVRVVNEKGDKEILTNYLYGMKEGEKIELWDQGDGKVYTKWTYKDNILHGEYKKWKEGGCTWIQGNYKNGKLDGPYTEWTSSGKKRLVGAYKDGLQDGLWTEWHTNGVKRLETNYKEGKIVGRRTSWYPNGQKAWQYNDEESISWDEKGNITQKKIYKDGKFVDALKP